MTAENDVIEGPRQRTLTLEKAYLVGLGVLLTGYACSGKPFAYIGMPPLFVGEMALIAGVFVFFYTRTWIAVFADRTSVLLGILMFWGLLRTIPFLREYGTDAVRDSVLIEYAVFAFIVMAIMLKDPDNLRLVISFLKVMTTLLVLVAPIALFYSQNDALQNWSPSESGALFYVKPGTTDVHLGGAALLALFGFRRASLWWLVLLFVGICVSASQGRGGMLSVLFMLTFAAIATNRVREFAGLAVVGALILGLAYALDLSIPTSRMRDISAVQVINNFASIFGGGDADQDGTKLWRIQWWHTIINYTINGPYFWAGKGFGINLALSDGLATGSDTATIAPLLRAPHSSHMHILARTGITGLILWVLVLMSWSASMLRNIFEARSRGDKDWCYYFTLIFCYAIGLIIDSTFDVTLEGPQAGIWFWSLIGLGTAASMIYARSSNKIANLREEPTSLLTEQETCADSK